jgi:hypothetical protein
MTSKSDFHFNRNVMADELPRYTVTKQGITVKVRAEISLPVPDRTSRRLDRIQATRRRITSVLQTTGPRLLQRPSGRGPWSSRGLRSSVATVDRPHFAHRRPHKGVPGLRAVESHTPQRRSQQLASYPQLGTQRGSDVETFNLATRTRRDAPSYAEGGNIPGTS